MTDEPDEPDEGRSTAGVIQYALSDPIFIAKGWTQLPTEKVVKKINVYRMKFVEPSNWFTRYKDKRLVLHKTGETLGVMNEDGSGGKWLYKNGNVALDYKKSTGPNESDNYLRVTIYSRGDMDNLGRGHPVTVLAWFDDQGNGIVLDHNGKTRLKYNQSEGVVLDRTLGPETRWLWHSLNNHPVIEHVMIDTELLIKDPSIIALSQDPIKINRKDEAMLAIEYENFVKQKTAISKPYIAYQNRLKVLKINDNFSLRFFDQRSVLLSYREGSTNLRLNLGMKLDNSEIIDVKTSDLDDVLNPIDCLPASSESIANLQTNIFNMRAKERAKVERERAIRPNIVLSTDKFETLISHPLRKGRTRSRSLSNSCRFYP